LKPPALPKELSSRSAVEKVFEETRRRGLAIVESHHLMAGVAAISAPVFNARNEITLAVSAVGIQGMLDTGMNGAIVMAVKSSADALSRKLGYRGGDE